MVRRWPRQRRDPLRIVAFMAEQGFRRAWLASLLPPGFAAYAHGRSWHVWDIRRGRHSITFDWRYRPLLKIRAVLIRELGAISAFEALKKSWNPPIKAGG